MAELSAKLVLASASPRRRAILETLGLAFAVVPSAVDESRREGEDPEAYVRRLSAEKARAVAKGLVRTDPGAWVLGADTTVTLDAHVLEKPYDDAESAAMIRRLSGRSHRVITGVSVTRVGQGDLRTIAESTEVTFRTLAQAEIRGYVDSGEGRDKAGAYGIQGLGSGLVRAVHGDYFNVVGLPASAVVELLAEVGALRRWP